MTRRYRAIAATAWRQELAAGASVVGRVAFYAVILLIFSRLWHVVFEQGGLPERSPAELLWYLALTEWVVLSAPPLHLDIEADARSGDVAYRLPRPISYLGARLAEAAGAMATRLLSLGLAGVGLVLVMAGEWPREPAGLLLALPLGVLASVVNLLFVAAIGLSALWLHDASPVYWIWQKCAFVLGGLLLPLEIYPEWLRGVASWTPFPALMHGVGSSAFGWNPELALRTGAVLVGWGLVAAVLLAGVYRRGLRALDVGGG